MSKVDYSRYRAVKNEKGVRDLMHNFNRGKKRSIYL